MTTLEVVVKILQERPDSRVTDLIQGAGVSRQMVHRALKSLVESGRVMKIGSAPRTFYRIADQISYVEEPELSTEESRFLERHFLLVTETGKRLSGTEAFQHWCSRQKLPFEKTIKEFLVTRKKYLAYFLPNGVISGLSKIKSTKGFVKIGLDEVFYLDFYAIERFGKTRLGMLLHFAKQGQNVKLMDEIVLLISDAVDQIISTSGIEAVGYIPPTIRREVQFMKVLERKLNLALPHIQIFKVKGEIAVPQKALSKIEDRISNAQFSIMVGESRKFGNVLLIDDAVGSGATLNETAIKLKEKGIAKTVTGLAITGSFQGFEVIQEV